MSVTTFLLSIIAISTLSASYATQTVSTIYSTGIISYWPTVNITVNPNKVIGFNNLSLGFMLDYEWKTWQERSSLRQLADDANFKLIRLFSIRIEPCISWDDASKTGTFNWVEVDFLVQRILEIGGEPFIALGYADSNGLTKLPKGMITNPTTGLPYPDSWAAYCREWVKHFKQTGKSVKYYELINEPWSYFGWNNYTRLGYFTALFNAAAQAMRAENPEIRLGFDGTNRKPVLNYWLNPSFGGAHQVGANLDFISFHKYDSGVIGQYSDQQMFNLAETFQFITDTGGLESGYYGVEDARQLYYSARGEMIPVIISESNFNSAWQTGTDPKIQQMAGAVWLSIMLRKAILLGVNYNIYFTFASSKSWETTNKPSGGCGFGMVNLDDNKPWYPYYVQWMIGSNLKVGDAIVDSVSSSQEIKVLSWINEGKLKILLINTVNEPRIIYLNGLSSSIKIIKIDNDISWGSANLQITEVNPTEAIVLNGYAVVCLI
ncbi:MAG: hypothetical protein QW279_04585 [Candidatus Jordarchaeaceae archaeon]